MFCALLVCAVAALGAPTSALAHSGLRASVPAADATLDAPPKAIVLEFGGEVVVAGDGIQVFDDAGTRVDVGDPKQSKGTRIVQPIRATAGGTYGVAYRVSSGDGHVVTGAYSFVVGAGGQGADGGAARDASRKAATTATTVQALFSGVRAIELLTLLVAAGAGLFATVIAPGLRPRLLLSALVLLLVTYAAGYVLNAALVHNDGLGDALNPDHWRDAAQTPFAVVVQLRAFIALVAVAPAVLLAATTRALPAAANWLLALVFAGLAASAALTGHAVTTEPVWLRLSSDIVHLVAAAVWIGGLVQLWFLARDAERHTPVITRYSNVAFGSVVVLLASGVVTTLIELDVDLGALLNSEYGRLITAKVILLLAAMPLAWNNRRAFVPALERRPDDAPRLLRQYVAREFALLLVVIGITTWLIATPQP